VMAAQALAASKVMAASTLRVTVEPLVINE
jgi:hypothetical protein